MRSLIASVSMITVLVVAVVAQRALGRTSANSSLLVQDVRELEESSANFRVQQSGGEVFIIDSDETSLPSEVSFDTAIAVEDIAQYMPAASQSNADVLVISASLLATADAEDLAQVVDNHHILFVVDSSSEDIALALDIDGGDGFTSTAPPNALLAGSFYYRSPISNPSADFDDLWTGSLLAPVIGPVSAIPPSGVTYYVEEPDSPPYNGINQYIEEVLADTVDQTQSKQPDGLEISELCRRGIKADKWLLGLGRRVGSNTVLACCPASAKYQYIWVYSPCTCLPPAKTPTPNGPTPTPCPPQHICWGGELPPKTSQQAFGSLELDTEPGPYQWWVLTRTETIGTGAAFHPWGAYNPNTGLQCSPDGPGPTPLPTPSWAYKCYTEEPDSWLAHLENTMQYHAEDYGAQLLEVSPSNGSSSNTTFQNDLSAQFSRGGVTLGAVFKWAYSTDTMETQVDTSFENDTTAWTHRDNNILAQCGCTVSEVCADGWRKFLGTRNIANLLTTPGSRANQYFPGHRWSTAVSRFNLEAVYDWNLPHVMDLEWFGITGEGAMTPPGVSCDTSGVFTIKARVPECNEQ